MTNARFRFPASGSRRSSSARRGRAARGARGFTLVELLVAITLFGLIAVMLLAGLRFGTRAWEAGVASADETAEVHLAQSFLRRELSRAREAGGGEPGEEPAFAGTRDELRFVAPLPDHVGVAGLYRLSVYLDGGPGARRLMVAWRLVRAEADPVADEEMAGETVLLDDVADAEFSYLARQDGDAAGVWLNGWQEEEGLPALVRVRVEFAGDDRRVWPDLVVAPRITPGA